MTQAFVNALNRETNFTRTENGAVALKSTGSALVDLFGQLGAMRDRSDREVEAAFIKGFAEDRLLATKLAFYTRDIRFGGLGERKVFRTIIRFLANVHTDVLVKNIQNIPVFGRFDDLYVLVGTPAENDMWQFIGYQWNIDRQNMQEGKSISVMAKWLKSANASSEDTRRLGKLTAQKLGLSEKAYRKSLSVFREYLNIVERHMTGGKWEKIEYSKVPSKAMTLYRQAFGRRDTKRFGEYIASVEKGEQKINASTLFPYDILEGMCKSSSYRGNFELSRVEYDAVLEAQWRALPNYVEGENNIIVMADTSSSMETNSQGRPMATSVGLAIYFAERNKGPYKDLFMTFSSRPSWVKISGNTLYEKLQCVPEIVDNTNLEAAFMLILETAISNNLSADEIPKTLVVVSDMQFDSPSCTGGRRMTFLDSMEALYARHGYTMPNIIFWNVHSRLDTFQATSDHRGVQLASGQSPSVFKSILKNVGLNPYEVMVNTLSNPVYDCITV